MMKFASVAIAAGMFALGVQAASAADLRAAPVYKAPPAPVAAYQNWTGVYVGINGGGGWADSRSGGLVGGTLGYNYQISNWVLGIEGDMDWASIKGDQDFGLARGSIENTWLATVRGRVGYSFGPALVYATGGGAFGDIKRRFGGLGGSFSESSTESGWTVGGGLEYAFAPNWSVKGEYLYVRFDDIDCGFVCGGGKNKVEDNLFRVGVNYKFGGEQFVGGPRY